MRQQWSVFERTIRWRPWGCHTSIHAQVLGWCSIVGAVAFLIGVMAELWTLKQQQQVTLEQHIEAQTRLAQVQVSESRDVDEASATNPLSGDTLRGLNRVIRHLNTPWPGVFDTLERLTPPDVALIRIEPSGDGLMTIEAESTEIDKLMLYAAGLEHQGVFGAVSLRRHVTNDRDPNRPARLMFVLAFREDN